jgi:dTDP-4-amino-4,6-dideoxygalactose transaminase
LNYGVLSTLSFHATKLFHTIEGGAITSNDGKIIEKLELLRNFGITSEEEVVLPGINAKMNEFQAIMGLCNLENIDEKIHHRKIIYDYYKEKIIRYNRYNISENNHFQI